MWTEAGQAQPLKDQDLDFILKMILNPAVSPEGSKDHTPGGAFLLSAVLSLKNREMALEGPEIRSILYAI